MSLSCLKYVPKRATCPDRKTFTHITSPAGPIFRLAILLTDNAGQKNPHRCANQDMCAFCCGLPAAPLRLACRAPSMLGLRRQAHSTRCIDLVFRSEALEEPRRVGNISDHVVELWGGSYGNCFKLVRILSTSSEGKGEYRSHASVKVFPSGIDCPII